MNTSATVEPPPYSEKYREELQKLQGIDIGNRYSKWTQKRLKIAAVGYHNFCNKKAQPYSIFTEKDGKLVKYLITEVRGSCLITISKRQPRKWEPKLYTVENWIVTSTTP